MPVALFGLRADELAALSDPSAEEDVEDELLRLRSDDKGLVFVPRSELRGAKAKRFVAFVAVPAFPWRSMRPLVLEMDDPRQECELVLPAVGTLDFELRTASGAPVEGEADWAIELSEDAARVGGLEFPLFESKREGSAAGRQCFRYAAVGTKLCASVDLECGNSESFEIDGPRHAGARERRVLRMGFDITTVRFEVADAAAHDIGMLYVYFDKGDGDPRYELVECVEGRCVLRWSSSAEDAEIRRVLIDDGPWSGLSADLPCRLRTAAANDLGRIVLTQRSRSMSGRAVDDRGAPVPGCRVRVSFPDDGPRYRALAAYAEVKADAKGAFEIRISPSVPEGACLVVSQHGYEPVLLPLKARSAEKRDWGRVVLKRLGSAKLALPGYPDRVSSQVKVYALRPDGKLGRCVRTWSSEALIGVGHSMKLSRARTPSFRVHRLPAGRYRFVLDFGSSGAHRGKLSKDLSVEAGAEQQASWDLGTRRFEFVAANPPKFRFGPPVRTCGRTSLEAIDKFYSRLVVFADQPLRDFVFRHPSARMRKARFARGRHVIMLDKN